MSIIEVPEGAHSILGPSSAERWINCPGSVLATEGLPDVPSRYALEGTAAHTLSEWIRVKGIPAHFFIDTTIRVTRGEDHWDVKVDEEMADSVQEFCDRVAEHPGVELVETRVRYERYVQGGFGTLDSGHLTDEVGWITDFKHGQGVKKYAKDNPQLMLYALGVLQDYWWLYEIPRFVLAIAQPRLDHYDEWEVSSETLHKWAEDIAAPAALLALTPGAPFKTGEWCQFCKIKATCKTRAKAVFDEVLGDFHDLDTVAASAEAVSITVPLMTNEEIAKALHAWPWIEKWGAALKDYAMREVLEGRTVGDFKLVEGRSNRAWGAPEREVEEALLHAGANRESIFTKPELVTPSKAEKLIGKKAFAELTALVKKPKGKPALVSGDDPRPAIGADALDGFEELTEE
jgi:hypothetical protein